MTNESSNPIRSEEEPAPDAGRADEQPIENQDYVSELRESLDSESSKDTPKRKTGFFERFTKRLRPPPANPVDAQLQMHGETVSQEPVDDISLASIEVDDLSTALSTVSSEEIPEERSEQLEADIEFSEPAQPEPVNLDNDLLASTAEESVLTTDTEAEESSQWKSFLATLWKPSEKRADEDTLDDETLASRVERSLPHESEVDNQWAQSDEAVPFVFDQKQPDSELPDGKQITGSFVLDEGEEIFSEGEGNIWSGLRQEIQETQEDISVDEPPEIVQDEEFEPALNVAFAGWEGNFQDQDLAEAHPLESEGIEEDFIDGKSRPFSEEYAEVFEEEPVADAILEPEPSVEEIRTIVMEDYEESADDARVRAKPTARWLRTVLLVLIGVGLVVLIGILSMPTIMQWLQPPPPPVAAVQPPTAIPMEGMPYPTGIRMTGGWFFYLQPSTIEDGRWVPTTSEWLDGSELRRVVALPWTRQLEAVVQSLVVGDTIELHMSNGDILTFLVEETSQVDRSDVSILTSNQPSLALVLYKEEEDMRWVVIANQQ